MKKGIVLLGHGSILSSQTAKPVYKVAAHLRKLARYDDVRVAFWKEPPYLSDAIVQVRAQMVTIVPMFMASGYFTSEVVPSALKKESALVNLGQSIFVLPALGEHFAMFEMICEVIERASRALLRDLSDKSLPYVVLVGHGTRRNGQSSALIHAFVERLNCLEFVDSVYGAFLDEAPLLDDIMRDIPAGHVIVLPYFMSNGHHVSVDIPLILGINFENDSEVGAKITQVGSHRIWYDGALGMHEEIAHVVEQSLDLVKWDHLPLVGFDRVWALDVDRYLAFWVESFCKSDQGWHLGELSIVFSVGGFWVYLFNDVFELCDHIDEGTLFLLVRERNGERCRLPYEKNLKGGWRVFCKDIHVLRDVIDLIYPSLLLHKMLWAQGLLNVNYFEPAGIKGREQRYLASLKICDQCIKQPVWLGRRAEGAPCDRMCQVVQSGVVFSTI